MVATVATANWQHWPADPAIRQSLHNFATRPDAPPHFTRWWHWLASAQP
ncbi:hypothetical protein LG943_10960 [Streptomonospora sp. S1-112]|uniref:Uncharacterized protein n=1 Tax=Streptomonospora mangrovi TaxID=2883123 RepID=A0A9X3SH46_9ACTN|nr:hypothetical protein [Streptomonospora mangrovi]MDA0564839.1 hypothetical protein [Streptomonospora mangrovi]